MKTSGASYQARAGWQIKHSDPECVTLAIYNTGRHLFMNFHCRMIADTFPETEWCWIRYRDFCVSKFLLTKANFLRKKIRRRDVFKFRHMGHKFRRAFVRLGNSRDSKKQVIKIPASNILYVAIKNGNIIDTQVIHQPLPIRLFSITSVNISPIELR